MHLCRSLHWEALPEGEEMLRPGMGALGNRGSLRPTEESCGFGDLWSLFSFCP